MRAQSTHRYNLASPKRCVVDRPKITVHSPSYSLLLPVSRHGQRATKEQETMPSKHSTLSKTFWYLTALIPLGLLLTNTIGCNSESTTNTVDPPPISTDLEATPESEPPGTMELPSGKIPPAATESSDPSDHSGGLELPTTTQQPNDTPVIQYATWSEVEEVVQSTGKVTVLDIWSTVCVPCIKELPGLVELHKTHGDKVQCITLDVDFDGRASKPPKTYEDAAKKILTAVDATLTNYISKTSSEEIYSQADIASIPAVLVFDANGKLVKKFVDAGDGTGFGYHKDVIPFVKTLLK